MRKADISHIIKAVRKKTEYKEEPLRYDGVAKVVKDDVLLSSVREAMPQIMAIYDKNGGEMGLFYLENGHAEIRGMMEPKEETDV